MRLRMVPIVFALVALPAVAATLTLPATITEEAAGPAGAAVQYTATATAHDIGTGDDENGRPIGTVSLTCAPASGSTFPLGTTTVNCTVSDGTTGSFKVVVRDTIGPDVSHGGNITTTATSDDGAVISAFNVAAHDLVDGVRPVSCAPAAGLFPVGTTVVHCSAADSRGNRGAAAFTVTVNPAPQPPPALTVPADMTVEANGPAGSVVTYSVAGGNGSGGDDENGRPAGSVAVSCSPASGSTFPLGATLVTCIATSSGGTTSKSFTVTVADTTAPALEIPSGFAVQATSNDGAVVSYNASARDLVDGAVAVNCAPASGSTFAIGTTTVSCSAADSRGNSGTGSFTVTVTAAPQPPPDLTVPADMTVEANGPAGSVVTYSVAAGNGSGEDDENGRPTGNVAVSCSPASGSTFPLGATLVTCTATSSGGTTSKSFTVTVVDTTAPALDLPRGFTVRATSNDGAAVSYNASASDLVDGPVAIDCAPAPGSTFAIGTTTVSCTAADSRGNSANGSFDVTVTAPDAPPPDPELNLPDDITAEATGAAGAAVTFTATTSGNGDDENGRPNGPTVTCAPASGSVFPVGTTTVQCSAGNQSGTFLVHVVDTTAPELSLPAGITTSETIMTWDASANDLVDGNVAVTCDPPSGATFPRGTTTVDCSAADTRGNTATGSFDVTVNPRPVDRTVTVSASPDKLWPPDHKMVDVTITVTTSDQTPVTAEIVHVASSETNADDNTSPDWIVTGPLTLKLRAEKGAQTKVRIYTIDVKIADEDGNQYLERATVTVTNANATSTSLSRAPRG